MFANFILIESILSVLFLVFLGFFLAFLFMCMHPFSKFITFLHEYGHYSHLKNVICKELNISCDSIDLGIRPKWFIFYEGKTFNSAYDILSASSYNSYISENARAGTKLVCKILFFSFLIIAVVCFFFCYQLAIIWGACGFFLIGIELWVYITSSDHYISKDATKFTYNNNNYDEYIEHLN